MSRDWGSWRGGGGAHLVGKAGSTRPIDQDEKDPTRAAENEVDLGHPRVSPKKSGSATCTGGERIARVSDFCGRYYVTWWMYVWW